MVSGTQNNASALLKKSLLEFYKNQNNLFKFINVIQKNTEYSLRILEWFCSNYAKKHNIIYTTSKNKEFNVYLSYKGQLDSYHKLFFDPFKRDHEGYGKFELKFSDKPYKAVETTVGQLNFFKWCIVNEILEYVKSHITEIKNDMNVSVNYTSTKKPAKKEEKKVTPKKEPRKKRETLSVPSQTYVKRDTKVVLKFK
jgi:hypothetical protein